LKTAKINAYGRYSTVKKENCSAVGKKPKDKLSQIARTFPTV